LERGLVPLPFRKNEERKRNEKVAKRKEIRKKLERG
jgi:hypothetical protein